ncbi:UNVERIFIED_CONTAM: zinc ribbon domain-containing protein [Campylobacter lari]
MQCLSCQFKMKRDSKFCPECGSKIVKSCQACKATLSPSAKFCLECGAKVE